MARRCRNKKGHFTKCRGGLRGAPTRSRKRKSTKRKRRGRGLAGVSGQEMTCAAYGKVTIKSGPQKGKRVSRCKKFKGRGSAPESRSARYKAKRGVKSAKRSLRTSSKPCVVKSGTKKGKLKKGWKFGKNGRCLRAKAA